VPAYGPQNDVTLKMPAFEWVHVQLHQQKGMISLSPPTICNSATKTTDKLQKTFCLSVGRLQIDYNKTTKKLQKP
ncbi:hypothetical protein, partial [Escherichia coli]|uniref:hypothetical protein n=1 Tax=Escherichia coli TaxID=562 RepID=UPI001CA40896|nr:hypothetical protein [Escherichia coli]